MIVQPRFIVWIFWLLNLRFEQNPTLIKYTNPTLFSFSLEILSNAFVVDCVQDSLLASYEFQYTIY